MANWGKAFKGLASGFREGRKLEDEEKRTRIAEESMLATKQAQAEERQMRQVQQLIEAKRIQILDLQAKTENEKAFSVKLESLSGVEFTPAQKDALIKTFPEGMDVSPYIKEVKNKDGVIGAYTFETNKSRQQELDNTLKVLEIKNKKAELGIRALQEQNERRKLEQGDADPGTALKYIVGIAKTDPKYAAMTPEEKIHYVGSKLQTEFPLPAQSAPISKSAQGKVEEGLFNITKQLSDLETTATTFMPEFLTWKGQIKNWSLDKILKAGQTAENIYNLSPEDRKYVRQFTQFVNSVGRVHNRYVNDVSGAAFSIEEMKRYEESLFNAKQNYESFTASFNEYNDFIKKGYRLQKYAIEKGLSGEDISLEVDRLHKIGTDPTQDKAYMRKVGDEFYNKFKREHPDRSEDDARDWATLQLVEKGYLK